MNYLKEKLQYFKSKTLLFFGVVGPLLVQYAQQILAGLTDNLPALKEYLPEDPLKTMGVVLLVGGVLLRVITKAPLGGKS